MMKNIDAWLDDHLVVAKWIVAPILALLFLGAIGLMALKVEKFVPKGKGYTERCIDGVAYIDSFHGITPKVKIDKALVACHE